MDFSSKLLENAVNEVARLPGIGKRTALRLVLHLLKQPIENTNYLTESLQVLRTDVKSCEKCHNISDTALCEICNNPKRDSTIVCVVEDIRDVMAIENTSQYRGLYHVLGGKISPIEGIGPQNLEIESLIEKVKNNEIKELIFMLIQKLDHYTIMQLSRLMLFQTTRVLQKTQKAHARRDDEREKGKEKERREQAETSIRKAQ